MKRFIAAQFMHETNTFSSVPTPLSAFGSRKYGGMPREGEAVNEALQGTRTGMGAYIDLAAQEGAELNCVIAGNAQPSRPVDDEAFEYCADKICEAVRAGGDALFLDLHGAMVTQSYDDGEGELLRRIREIDSEIPIAVALDFHTNLSAAMVENATVIAGYTTYPHIDLYETAERAGHTLLRAMSGEVSPVMVWHSLPMLTHMNCQTPARQPMKDIMDKTIAAEDKGGILNASVFGCFPLADIPHVGFSSVVVADGDRGQAEELLKEIIEMAWERRADFIYKSDPIAETIAQAKSLGDGPIVLADHGDNCGAGGPQDSMDVLAEIIRQGLTDVVAGPLPDPESVEQMLQAGKGATVTLQLGGKTDTPSMNLKGKPLQVTGIVKEITDGRFTVTGEMMKGVRFNMGRCAVLDTGNVEILVSEQRLEPMDAGCFTHAGIDPSQKKYILVKSRQHFRAGFEAMAKHILMVAGPGCCSSDYDSFPWKNLRRPIYPLDMDAPCNL